MLEHGDSEGEVLVAGWAANTPLGVLLLKYTKMFRRKLHLVIVLTIQKYVFRFQSHSESFKKLRSRWKYSTPVPLYLLYLLARLQVQRDF